MERYQRINKPLAEAPIKENEVRVTTQGLMRNYISYALTLFQEKRSQEIVLKAMGRAINKTVLLAEILKKRVEGLHQDVSISSVDITDTWEPLEEGLVPVETTRHVSMITILLSKKELDVSSSGYQPPSSTTKVEMPEHPDNSNFTSSVPRGRGRAAVGRGQGRGRGDQTSGYYSNYREDSYNGGIARGGGRGRGYYRGGRGYGNGYARGNAGRYDDGSYWGNGIPQRARGRGRGRGFGGLGGRGQSRGRGR